MQPLPCVTRAAQRSHAWPPLCRLGVAFLRERLARRHGSGEQQEAEEGCAEVEGLTGSVAEDGRGSLRSLGQV